MYSSEAGIKCFPVQLFEALTSLAIAMIVTALARKKEYKPTGTLYPVMLVLYGGTRFVWEFFSASPRVFCGITELGLWAFATLLLGIAWLITFLIIRLRRKN